MINVIFEQSWYAAVSIYTNRFFYLHTAGKYPNFGPIFEFSRQKNKTIFSFLFEHKLIFAAVCCMQTTYWHKGEITSLFLLHFFLLKL